MLVKDIVPTLSGEGKYTGYPTTIIRLYNCNLNCSYCDDIAEEEEKQKSITMKNLIEAVNRLGNKYVLITGGEPLLQKEEVIPFVYELLHIGYIPWIETNGSIAIEKESYRRSFGYCMDIKLPSSGMMNHNVYGNLEALQRIDEVKFVIGDYKDYMVACSIIKQYPTFAEIIFSPVMGKNGENIGKELAEWMISDKIKGVRLGLQIHHYLDIY